MIVPLLLAAFLFAPSVARGEVRLRIDTVASGGASAVNVAVRLDSGGAAVGGVQLDLLFDHRAIRLSGDSSCQIEAAISDRDPACESPGAGGKPCKTMSRHLAACDSGAPGCGRGDGNLSRFRALIASTTVLQRSVIPDGAVLFTCRFDILDRSRLPSLVAAGLSLASDVDGRGLATVGSDGAIAVNAPSSPLPTWTPIPTRTPRPSSTPHPSRTPTQTPTITRTYTVTRTATITATPAPLVVIAIGRVARNGLALVPVSLSSDGLTVGGVQNDILFDSRIAHLDSAASCRLAAEIGDRQPGCELDPPQGPCKTLSRSLVSCGQSPTPPGCDGYPAYISRFRAIVAAVAVPNNNAIPDGVLYTCEFAISGEVYLANRNVVAASPVGERLPALGRDGDVSWSHDGLGIEPPATWTPSASDAEATGTAPPPRTFTPTSGATHTPPATPTRTAANTATPLLWLTRPAAESADAVAIAVRLAAGGTTVGGAQSDLLFDTRALTLASASDCRIDAAIGDRLPNCEGDSQDVVEPCKTLSRNLVSCGEQPTAPGCEGQPPHMSRLRGIVAATAVPNRNPIPDGAVLYTCNFRLVDADNLPTDVAQVNPVLASPTGARIDGLALGLTVFGGPGTIGWPCGDDGACEQGFCVDQTCCSTVGCPPNQFCNVTTAPGTCSPLRDEASGCNIDGDCRSGNCDLLRGDRPIGVAGVCGPMRTPTPRSGLPSSCATDLECGPGTFCNLREGGVCCDHRECPASQSCRVPGAEGVCRGLPTPTPSRLPNLSPCSPDRPELCQSGNCVDNICCSDRQCAASDRCDIFQFEGRCLPPHQEGVACAKNTDCEAGLQCRNDDGTGLRCTFRPPTPTRIPTPPATPTLAETLTVSGRQDDGCAIAPSQSRSFGLVWPGLAALFIRRRIGRGGPCGRPFAGGCRSDRGTP